MEYTIDYGDVGYSLGVEGFLLKKKRRLERLSNNAMCLNIEIRAEVTKGKDLPDSYAVDLEWISNRGVFHFVTGQDRSFFKAASEAFDLMVRKINRSKKGFERESIIDHLSPEIS